MWPTNPFLPRLSGDEVARLEDAAERFELAWRAGGRPDPAAFVPADGPRLPTLIELVGIDREYCRAAGEDADAGGYLRRFPELAAVTAVGRVGRFELAAEVGAGSFGRVYRAVDPDLGRAVAVKVPHPERLTPADRGRLLREARCSARLRHPNIAALYEVLDAGGLPVLVGEFVDGRPLSEWAGGRRVEARAAAELVAAVADALHYAHGEGVVHRDVKPSNVLIDRDGRPRLLDFGLAKLDAADTLTADGQLLGTPAYMAPEQARGEPADARADVYGLGVILYELLTGERPFRGTARAVLAQIADGDPAPPRRLAPEVPRDLETVCLKAVARLPADRYATAGAFADDLRRWLRGEPVAARPVGWPGRVRRWCRRRPVPAALAAGLVVSVAGGVAGMGWQWQRAEDRRREAEAHAAAASREQDRAEDHFRVTHRALADLVGIDRINWGPDRTPHHPIELATARKAVKYYQYLADERPGDPEVLFAAALAQSVEGLLRSREGDSDGAAVSQRTSLELFARLRRTDPTDIRYQWGATRSFYRLADAHEHAGRPADAVEPARQACRGFVELVNERPDVDYFQINLRNAITRLWKAESALHGPGGAVRRLHADGWLAPPAGAPTPADRVRVDAFVKVCKLLAGRSYWDGDEGGEALARRAAAELEAGRPGGP